jgi:peptide chain release factor 1
LVNEFNSIGDEDMSIFLNRCQKVVDRYHTLDALLQDPATLSEPKKLAKYAKEQSTLQEVVDTFTEYQGVVEHLKQAQSLLNEDDVDLKEMAQLEISELTPQLEELEAKLQLLLLPKDPDDDKNVIMEIRGAAGGDEGNIFAGDLYRMYAKFAETKGWKIEVLDANEAEAGGYTLISFVIKGSDVYHFLKFESGAHRVQRVPKTETQGRIHTSTATVLAMAEVEAEDFEINDNDLIFETHRSSGAGGQSVNKTDSAVRVTHVPTGISVNMQEGRSQHDNRDKALKMVRARVYEAHMEKIEEAKGKERQSKIGRGSRSEKIRTYNYPQNRLTDHRIGFTLVQLDRVMEGKLDDVLDALLAFEQTMKMEQPLDDDL